MEMTDISKIIDNDELGVFLSDCITIYSLLKPYVHNDGDSIYLSIKINIQYFNF